MRDFFIYPHSSFFAWDREPRRTEAREKGEEAVEEKEKKFNWGAFLGVILACIASLTVFIYGVRLIPSWFGFGLMGLGVFVLWVGYKLAAKI